MVERGDEGHRHSGSRGIKRDREAEKEQKPRKVADPEHIINAGPS